MMFDDVQITIPRNTAERYAQHVPAHSDSSVIAQACSEVLGALGPEVGSDAWADIRAKERGECVSREGSGNVYRWNADADEPRWELWEGDHWRHHWLFLQPGGPGELPGGPWRVVPDPSPAAEPDEGSAAWAAIRAKEHEECVRYRHGITYRWNPLHNRWEMWDQISRRWEVDTTNHPGGENANALTGWEVVPDPSAPKGSARWAVQRAKRHREYVARETSEGASQSAYRWNRREERWEANSTGIWGPCDEHPENPTQADFRWRVVPNSSGAPEYADKPVVGAPESRELWRVRTPVFCPPGASTCVRLEDAVYIPGFIGYVHEMPDGEERLSTLPVIVAIRWGECSHWNVSLSYPPERERIKYTARVLDAVAVRFENKD